MVKRIFVNCLSLGVAASLAPLAGFGGLSSPQAFAAETAPSNAKEPVIPDRPEPPVPHLDNAGFDDPPRSPTPSGHAGAVPPPVEGAPLPAPIRDVLVKLHASNLETVAVANTAAAHSSRGDLKDFALSWRQGRLDLDKQLMVLLHEWDVPQTAIAAPAENLVTAFLRAPENGRLFRGKEPRFDMDFLAKAVSMQSDDLDQIQRLLGTMAHDPKSARLTAWLREAEAQAKEKRTEAEKLRAGAPEKDQGKP